MAFVNRISDTIGLALSDCNMLNNKIPNYIKTNAPTSDMPAIKDATFQPMLDLLIEGLDVQVFVYDKDNPTAAL